MKHPMQAIHMALDGVVRFQGNAIVQYLREQAGFDMMNKLATMEFSNEDRMQFAQLLGYSVSGFGDLPYADHRVVAVADMIVTKIINGGRTMAEPDSPREIVEQHRAQTAAPKAEARFKPGDVVVLRSGGPSMTVWGYSQTDRDVVNVEWFGGAELKREVFSEAEIEPAPPKVTVSR